MLKIISGPKLNPKPKLVPERVIVKIQIPVLVMSKLKIMPPPLEPKLLSMPCWLTAPVLRTVSTTKVPAVSVEMTMQTVL